MNFRFLERLNGALFQVKELFKSIHWWLFRKPLGALKNLIDPNKRYLGRRKPGRKRGSRKASGVSKVRSAVTDTARYWLGFFVLLFAFPFKFLRQLFLKGGREAILCLPACLAIVFVTFVGVRVVGQNAEIKNTYRRGLSKALLAGDFEKGLAFGQRLVSWPGEKKRSDQMEWTICLLQTGAIGLAFENLNQLAPNDGMGYPTAHRLKASFLRQQLNSVTDREILEQMFFHLNRADEQESDTVRLNYAYYFLNTDQSQKAVPYLKKAAVANPLLYSQLANIYRANNNFASFQEVVRQASATIPLLIKQDPSNIQARVEYAKLLVELERKDEALQVLEDGWALDKQPVMGRAIADFCLMLHDQSSDFDEQISHIKRSWDFDDGYFEAYQRLIRHFEKARPDNAYQIAKILDTLRPRTEGPNVNAMSLFAMGNLSYLQGSQADYQSYLERAFAIDPEFSIVANNLAWMLAHNEQQLDLDKAYRLINELVEKYPSNPRFRDTFGTVLLKQGKYEEALTQFEMILPRMPDKGPVHAKLADIYQRMDKPKLSAIHLQKSQQYSKSQEN